MIRPLHALLVPAAALALATLWIDQQPTVSHTTPTLTDVVEPVRVLTAAELPRHYTGTFLWDGESALYTQHLAMDLDQVATQDNLIVATGRGTYTTQSRTIDFDVRVEVDQHTGEFTMWESNPSVETGFVTNGRHVATVDGPFSLLSARWVGDDGLRGNLQLTAQQTSARQHQKKADCIQRKRMMHQRARAAQQRAQQIEQLYERPAQQNAVVKIW